MQKVLRADRKASPAGKKSISQEWLKSLLFLIAGILSVSSIVFAYGLNVLRSQILEMTASKTEFIQRSIDSSLQELHLQAALLEIDHVNVDTKRQMASNSQISSAQHIFSEQMSNISMMDRHISGIFIYYPHQNLIIGNLGCYAPITYYKLLCDLKSDGYFYWLHRIINSNDGFTAMRIDDVYRQSYIKTINYDDSMAGVIVIMYEPKEILETAVRNVPSKPEHQAIGLIHERSVVASTGNLSMLEQIITSKGGMLSDSCCLIDNRTLIHTRPSVLPDSYYLFSYDLTECLRPMIRPLIITALSFIALVIISIAYSIRFSRKNSRPLRRLINQISSTMDPGLNEFQALQKGIDSLLKDQIDKGHSISRQQSRINGLFLNMILNQGFETEATLYNAAKHYGIEFHNDLFTIAALSGEGCRENSLPRIRRWGAQKKVDLMASLINRKIILLFNYSSDQDEKDLIGCLEELLSSTFWRKVPIAAIGPSTQSVVSIPASYAEALAIIEDCKDASPGSIITFKPEGQARKGESNRIDISQFLSALDDHKIIEAKALLEPVIRQFRQFQTNPLTMRSSTALLEHKLEHLCLEHRVSVEDISENFFCYEEPDYLKENILVLLELIAEKKMKLTGDVSINITEKAKLLIQQNYTDPMLGLYRIAEELGVNNSYLSTRFKASFGAGILQYINSLRISLARDLLVHTNMTIKEIAFAVGYTSDISFIRVFKKNENQTPNSFRKKQNT